MKNDDKDKKMAKNAGKLGAVGILLCGACCALPILPFIGVGLAASLGFWFEKIALVLFISSALLIGAYFIRKSRKKKACSIDCGCKEKAASADKTQTA